MPDEPTIIAITNQKGGVGKTTSTINLAHALVERGKRVLAIDADPQASLTIYFGHEPHSLERQEKTLYFPLVQGIDLNGTVIDGNPALIPSSIRLSRADKELINKARYTTTLLREIIREVNGSYDFVLIDCMPHLGILTSNALSAAHYVLIPVRTEYLSIEGIPLILEEIDETQRHSNRNLKVLGILPTMFDGRTNNDKEALAALQTIGSQQGIRIFDPVSRSTKYDRATPQGKPTLVLEPDAPGVDAYYKLADAIIDHE